MNEELHELETELRRLRPRGPSEFFDARIETALATRERANPGVWRGLAAAGFAAGIAWLAAFTPAAVDPAQTTLRPVDAQRQLQSAQDEGWVTLDDGTKAERVRLRFLETVRWTDGERTLTWTLPREELRILPAAAY